MVLIPIITGLIYGHLTKGRWLGLTRLMPAVSMGEIALIIAVILAAGRANLLTVGLGLCALILVHNLLGYFFGYFRAQFGGLDRTLAFEVGMQNSGLAIEMGKITTLGLAPAIFEPIMNMTGSSLAAYCKKKIK
tara:strand:+ start:73 stop:474 length:402 start_codon:yes stop_codon:yes gene_type:complete